MTWDEFFMGMAFYVSRKSKDPSTKVGAAIAKKKKLKSIGFNGPPANVDDDPSMSREVKYRRTIHAEVNAILSYGKKLKGCTIYVTHHPCSQCAAKIIQVKIKRVVCPRPTESFLSRWGDDIIEAKKMFSEANVEIVECDYDENWDYFGCAP